MLFVVAVINLEMSSVRNKPPIAILEKQKPLYNDPLNNAKPETHCSEKWTLLMWVMNKGVHACIQN